MHPAARTILFAGIVLLFASTRGFGAGTTAGTSVTNQATINFQVQGIGQTPATSNTYEFLVDRKIDLTVATTDTAEVQAAPGSTINAIAFRVTNTGNDVQDFALTAYAKTGGVAAFGGTDTINATAVSIFIENGSTAGYQSGEDTATFIDELAADANAIGYIVGNFAGTFSNGSIASYHLVAEARAGGSAGGSVGAALSQTTGAGAQDAVDVVFADGQGSDTTNDALRDAKHSDDSDFIVTAANLTVTKTSAVISDPSNGTTNPKAIPGAVIEYTVTIANAAGAATAGSVIFTDDLTSEIASIDFVTTGGFTVTAPNINGGSEQTLTPAADADVGTWNGTTNVVTVTGIQVAATQSATIKFRVTVR